jgi:iron(III) transport system substrate-binding protein
VKRLGWVILTVAVSAVCFILSFSYMSQRHDTSTPEITITATPVTRTITWYTSVPLKDAERTVNAYKLKTGVAVEMIRNSAFTVRDRLMSEIAAGKTEADVVTIADIGTFIELKNRQRLMKYDSPQYEFYSVENKDPGYWAIFTAFGICMAYDTNRISNPPLHWMELLDGRWKGKIGLEDINTAGSQYGQYYMLREMLGTAFWKDLLAVQEPRIFSKTEDLANALLEGQIDVAGEFSTYTVYNYRVKKGTSIQGIYPDEGIPLIVTPIAILDKTAHPDDAKSFLDFILSREGQELTRNLNYSYSVRGDVPFFEEIPSLDRLKIVRPANAAEYGAKRSEYIHEFNSFLESAGRK